MPENIILKAGFTQPLFISLLQLLVTASDAENMALGLRQKKWRTMVHNTSAGSIEGFCMMVLRTFHNIFLIFIERHVYSFVQN